MRLVSMRRAIVKIHPALVSGIAAAAFACAPALAGGLVETVERVKPAIVGVGTYLKTRSPSMLFVATGFAVGEGRHVLTNAHAVTNVPGIGKTEARVVLVPGAGAPEARSAQLVAVDEEHDLALLEISGAALPTLQIGDSSAVREGATLAFTGFPLGLVLGLHHATHRGIVAAIAPVALPGIAAQRLNSQAITRIRNTPYRVFQLDAIAYPGNSGSPLYDPDSGAVYGILNSVFIRGTRETAASQPSGITYAIPGRHIREFLERENVVPARREP